MKPFPNRPSVLGSAAGSLTGPGAAAVWATPAPEHGPGVGGRGPECMAASGKALSQRQPHVAPAPMCHPKGQRVTRVSGRGAEGSSQCGPSKGQDRTPGGGQSAQQRERLALWWAG